MPLQEITIDTNVLLHANNEQEPRCAAAKTLIENIRSSAVRLCVDEGFDIDSAKNRSRIGHEYLAHLVFGTIGYSLVVQLALNSRIAITSSNVGSAKLKFVNQLVWDKSDRVFLRVAMNSIGMTLVSHDFDAFPVGVRAKVLKKLAVRIMNASEPEL